MLFLTRSGCAVVALLACSCVEITAEPVDDRPDATQNAAPKALLDPGSPQRVGTTLTLSGEESYDPDGDPIAYSWKEVGRRGTLYATGPSYSLFLSKNGEHIVELTVSDPSGASDTAKISVQASEANLDSRPKGSPAMPTSSSPTVVPLQVLLER